MTGNLPANGGGARIGSSKVCQHVQTLQFTKRLTKNLFFADKDEDHTVHHVRRPEAGQSWDK
jgi:hypothetical protein